MTERVIVFLNTEIPEVSKQLLECCFGCQYAKDVDTLQWACNGVCQEALRIQREIEGEMR